MIRRIPLLIIIFLLSLSASVSAAEPSGGAIEGQIVNGTAGGSSVADQEITLKTYLNDVETVLTTTTTNIEGSFVLDGLSTELGYGYEVMLTFQGAEYYGKWLNFDEGEADKSSEIVVYDSTTSDEAIKIASAHTVIYTGGGSLEIGEYYLVINEADRTYIGSKEIAGSENRKTLNFRVPSEATDLQFGGELMECCILKSEDGFSDTMPVIPGSKDVTYYYRINYNSGIYTFSSSVMYPTANYDLLVQGETVQVASDQLAEEEAVFIEETVFNHLSGSDFDSGDILMAQLADLPKIVNSTNNQVAIVWVALILVVLTGGFGFVYLKKKRKFQAVNPIDSPDQSRQRLLVELAQLDDDFQAGKITEDVYRRQRMVKKAQLVEIM